MLTQEYIGQLVEEYGDMVFRLSYTYLKNQADAEDTVQDVFLKIIESQKTFNDKSHEKAWILRVTVNTCKNKINLFWNKHKCDIDEIGEIPTYDTYHLDSDVLKAVLSLPEKYRVVIHMYYYEGYSTQEISQIIGKNEITVRSLLHRARKKLKVILKEGYDFE